MRIAWLVLLVLLAGCAQPSPPPAQGAAAPSTRVVPVAGDILLRWQHDCLVAGGLCPVEDQLGAFPRLYLDANETALAGHVGLRSNGTLPSGATVHALVTCDKAIGPGCGVLAEASGDLPLTLDLPSMDVPAGAAVAVAAYLEGGPDAAGNHFLLDFPRTLADGGQPQALVDASFTVRRDPWPAPELVPVLAVVDTTGDLQCGAAQSPPPDSPAWNCPFLSPYDFPFDHFAGPVIGYNVRLEWEADQPGTTELTLELSCWPGDSSTQPCTRLAEASVTGPSPLTVQGAGWAPRDVTLDVAPQAAGSPSPFQLPQSYHLHFEATVLVPPEDVRLGGFEA